MTNPIIYKCTEEDLEKYLSYLKSNPQISLNDFIQNEYFSKDKNKIVIASLAEQEIGGVDLTNANLQGLILKGAIFNDCNFTDAILCDADLTDVEFNNCKFIGTDFRGANLMYCRFLK